MRWYLKPAIAEGVFKKWPKFIVGFIGRRLFAMLKQSVQVVRHQSALRLGFFLNEDLVECQPFLLQGGSVCTAMRRVDYCGYRTGLHNRPDISWSCLPVFCFCHQPLCRSPFTWGTPSGPPADCVERLVFSPKRPIVCPRKNG